MQKTWNVSGQENIYIKNHPDVKLCEFLYTVKIIKANVIHGHMTFAKFYFCFGANFHRCMRMYYICFECEPTVQAKYPYAAAVATGANSTV